MSSQHVFHKHGGHKGGFYRFHQITDRSLTITIGHDPTDASIVNVNLKFSLVSSALSAVFQFADKNGRRSPQVRCAHLYATSHLGQESSNMTVHQVTNLERMYNSRFI